MREKEEQSSQAQSDEVSDGFMVATEAEDGQLLKDMDKSWAMRVQCS